MPSVSEDSRPPSKPTIGQRLLARLSRETSSGRFIPEMDGLRLVAIAMVFLFHLNGFLTVKSKLYYPTPPSGGLVEAALVGFRGVELFFVISGFILGLPFAAHYLKDRPKVVPRKYYLRRLTRLEPPYFVAMIASFLLALWVRGESASALLPHLAASLSYVHNLIYAVPSTVMTVAWSLEVEIQFYVLVPLLTLLFTVRNKFVRRASMLALMVVTLVAQSLFLHDSPRASQSILGYLQFFVAGFLLADVFLMDWNEVPRRDFYWDLVALAGWPLLFLALRSSVLALWVFPWLAFALYVAAFRGRAANWLFSNRWITAIGGMCYSIYLLHYSVISAVGRLTRRISEGLPYWAHLSIQLVLVGAAVLTVSSLYFVYLEKPCMRRDWLQRSWASVRRLLHMSPSPRPAGRQ